jgi:ribosomal protein S18 acetylase RimI-like enzyme
MRQSVALDRQPLCQTVLIRPYQAADQAALLALWRSCDVLRPWNDPVQDIARKLTVQPELFLLAWSQDEQLCASVMAGYDGHRGWINYLAVAPQYQRQGLGRLLLQQVEARLLAMGCAKLNLQVRASNTQVLAFYEHLGFQSDAVLSLGKRLIVDG